jgi:hypothetical protein
VEALRESFHERPTTPGTRYAEKVTALLTGARNGIFWKERRGDHRKTE